MDVSTKALETSRLVLRALRKEDAEAAFSGWTHDSAVAYYMPWNLHTSIQDTEDWLSIEAKKIDSPDTFNWGIVDKVSEVLI